MTAVADGDRAGVKPRLAALAWAVAAVSVVGFAAAWALAAAGRGLFDISANSSPDRFMVAYAVVGAVLASRRPANPIGWLLLGLGLVSAARGLAGDYALYALLGRARPASAVWAVWFVNWALTLLFPSGVLMFLLLLFPSGRPLTARWRVVDWLGAALAACYVVATWLAPGTVTPGPKLPSVPNPTGIAGWTFAGVVTNGVFLLQWVCLLAAAAGLFVRYRRSAGEERLQLKWFAFAAAVSLVLLTALLPVAIASDAGQVAFDAGVVLGIGLALPVAVGIAIMKYRLYAIDRIISRTLAYTIVTGLLAGVYTGLVLVATRGLSVHTPVAVAAATLAAAALFSPLRRRVQRAVDRRFNRARYDADQTVGAFAARLKDAIDLDSVRDDLTGVVQQTLEPAHISVWVSRHTQSEPLSGPAGYATMAAGLTTKSRSQPGGGVRPLPAVRRGGINAHWTLAAIAAQFAAMRAAASAADSPQPHLTQ